jgi:hypothetical protein
MDDLLNLLAFVEGVIEVAVATLGDERYVGGDFGLLCGVWELTTLNIEVPFLDLFEFGDGGFKTVLVALAPGGVVDDFLGKSGLLLSLQFCFELTTAFLLLRAARLFLLAPLPLQLFLNPHLLLLPLQLLL